MPTSDILISRMCNECEDWNTMARHEDHLKDVRQSLSQSASEVLVAFNLVRPANVEASSLGATGVTSEDGLRLTIVNFRIKHEP